MHQHFCSHGLKYQAIEDRLGSGRNAHAIYEKLRTPLGFFFWQDFIKHKHNKFRKKRIKHSKYLPGKFSNLSMIYQATTTNESPRNSIV